MQMQSGYKPCRICGHSVRWDLINEGKVKRIMVCSSCGEPQKDVELLIDPYFGIRSGSDQRIRGKENYGKPEDFIAFIDEELKNIKILKE